MAKSLSFSSSSSLDSIKERGKIIVLATNSATTIYYDRDDRLAGPEYDMTQSLVHFGDDNFVAAR